MAVSSELVSAASATLGVDARLLPKLADAAGDLALNLVTAALILVVTWFVARWAVALTRRALQRIRATRNDRTLQGFAVQVVRVAVYIVGLVAVLNRLGVQTTSIVAVLGAASLAIGLAMQGALSNVAAGVLLLLLRPYKVGDAIEVAGRTGTVRRLDLFTTELATSDNIKIVAPNSKVLGDVIVNFSAHPSRRIELSFDVEYEADIQQVYDLMRQTAAANAKVLADPAPWAGVTALKESAVVVTLHAWVANPDWFETKAALIRAVKEAFEREGLSIPYPHQVQVEKHPAGKAA
ncbi:mechanosensitive ion channel family protein [Caulobacter sp. 17J80-11]|uniref:mechanosensitive ion channel family protein n=1 Tax=Caulobacter sp. 17J80-11 TaxID=2763502 RepID=UPI0016539D08|nr:mechanosensitive ion channel family protein [Caulobacter sp. 17J80-11]MBC6980996.1 mechanosensitive ion channel family protein [Caulobacter sp. 17J80-11]